jgi:nicotinate phosphoribosyltransferase
MNLLMDFYELTMGQSYFNKRIQEKVAYFDLFFRQIPDNGGFVIANGIERCLKYLNQFSLSESDIDYLKQNGNFSLDYLNYLKNIKFSGDMWGVKDGTVVFPNEPVITIKAPLIEAQLIETALLLMFNHSSLITTKTNRIIRSALGRGVMEFGTRRAQGKEAAVEGALDAYIAGATGTACTLAGKKYNIPVLGTMAHSFVQSFDNEYSAFKAYAESYPDACVLLVDTYNTLKSGIPNAIRIQNEVLKPLGKKLAGIRIDSGDLVNLSKSARKMLDEQGLKDTKIIVSNSLDEYKISWLLKQNAPIDSFGVGENLITAKSNPVLGGVYKLVAVEQNNKVIPKIKISDNAGKVINPHFKNIFRLYDKNNKVYCDLLCAYDESLPPKLILNRENYDVKNIRTKMIENGKLIYGIPSIEQTRNYLQGELQALPKNVLKLENAETVKVVLSEKLIKIKNNLINSISITK